MSEPILVEMASDLNATRRLPQAIVEVANDLDGYWTPVPYAENVRVRFACAPEYGEAQFSRAYGLITRSDRTTPDEYAKLELTGKFVRITIPSEDSFAEAADDVDTLVWYGVIEQGRKRHLGNNNDIASGVQTWTAYGMARVLDRVLIDDAVIVVDGQEVRLPSPRPFNIHRQAGNIVGKNRSLETTDGVYTFTPDPTLTEEWTAWDAVNYLLKHHGPLDADGEPAANFSLRGQMPEYDATESLLAWYKIAAETRGRSVKQLLDQLIPRTRGVGYWVGYEEPVDVGAPDETGRGTITIHLFTFVSSDLILTTPNGDDVVIPENPVQVQWDFDRDACVASAETDELETLRYSKVIVEGQNQTITATFAFHLETDAPLKREWTDQVMDAYKQAAQFTEGYNVLAKHRQYQINAENRAAFQFVLKAWRLTPTWNQMFFDTVGDVEHYYWSNPPFIDNSHSVDPLGTPEWRVDQQSFGRSEWSNHDARFLEQLRIRADADFLKPPSTQDEPLPEDDTPEQAPEQGWLAPFIFGNNFDEATSDEGRFWMRWDEVPFSGPEAKLGATPTAYRILFRPREDHPGFFALVEGAPQTMLGLEEWTEPNPADPDAPDPAEWVPPAATDPLHSPINWGIRWKTLYVTATLDLGVPIRAEELTGQFGRRPHGTLRISIPDAYLDTLVPRTVVNIVGGVPVQSAEGRLLRDDRQRIARIAKAAAVWYGAVRQQLRLTRRRLTVPRLLRLGTLVVRTGIYYGSDEINTPITAVDLDCEQGTVTWETGFPELDLSP